MGALLGSAAGQFGSDPRRLFAMLSAFWLDSPGIDLPRVPGSPRTPGPPRRRDAVARPGCGARNLLSPARHLEPEDQSVWDVRALEIAGAEVASSRFEELLSRPDLHEAHDLLTIRAVRVETRVLMSLQAFVKPGGELFLFRSTSSGDIPNTLTPPLAWRATYPLLETLRSRLVVIEKRQLRR